MTSIQLQFTTTSMLTSFTAGRELKLPTETGHELMVTVLIVSNKWMIEPVKCKLIVSGLIRSVQS